MLGSNAKGCNVVIQYVNHYKNDDTQELSYDIPMDSSIYEGSTCIELAPSTSLRNVRIYDWEEDGSVGSVNTTPVFHKGSDTHCKLSQLKLLAYMHAPCSIVFLPIIMYMSMVCRSVWVRKEICKWVILSILSQLAVMHVYTSHIISFCRNCTNSPLLSISSFHDCRNHYNNDWNLMQDWKVPFPLQEETTIHSSWERWISNSLITQNLAAKMK